MLNLSSIMVDTANLQAMTDFYKEVFKKEPDMVDDTYTGWLVGNTFFSIGFHSEVVSQSQDPNRIILNFETKEVKEECERIKNIKGCKVVREPYEMGGAWIATLSDPDGNYFQLMAPWDNMSDQPKD